MQFIIEGVVPDFLLVLLVGDNLVLPRVRIPLLLWVLSSIQESFWPVSTMIPCCQLQQIMGRGHSPGDTIPSKVSFAHAGAIVSNEYSDFFVAIDLGPGNGAAKRCAVEFVGEE